MIFENKWSKVSKVDKIKKVPDETDTLSFGGR